VPFTAVQREWLGKQRFSDTLTPDRIALLNDIEFIFTRGCRTFFPNQVEFHAENNDTWMRHFNEIRNAKVCVVPNVLVISS
jgi:hypothetical protein